MRLLVWNIRQGGGARVTAIARAIRSRAPDVVVLTEVTHGAPSTRLREKLSGMGYGHQFLPEASPTARSVLLASRWELEHHETPALTDQARQRIACGTTGGITIIGAYFPSVAPHVLPFFDVLIPVAQRWLDRPAVIVGDINTGLNDRDNESARFSGQPGLERLLSAGWTDGWRHLNGDRREYTWYSHHGNGFRIDHAFLSPAALPFLKAARYDHAPRRRRVSDHSMLWVEFADRGI